MTFNQHLLRALFPNRERERMEMRHSVAKASAHAEDLSRTILKLLKRMTNDTPSNSRPYI